MAADGDAKTFAAVASALAAMKSRLERLSPVLKVIAEEITERTDASFPKSASPLGAQWATLATSTLIDRARRRSPAARKRQKNAPHRLTKGAKAKRVGFVLAYHNGQQGFGGVTATPLIDTGRMRKSQRTLVKNNALEWSAVGYMGPHMTGGKTGGKRGSRGAPKVRISAKTGKVLKARAPRPSKSTGTGTLPKRNPTVFEKTSGRWAMIPSMHSYVVQHVSRYVRTGKLVA